ncbi:MAG: DUF2179 domain-containing protein [Acidimicrobiia bacterium]|nr:DUF2179 domain-containing protein [Acidimicrobiia bacterium]MBT8215037.1 DUF2179 domain-containing protein [Acidimicrobiia bacterium]NNF69692.1 DUF2179 domain-containing protein [Acidimicrobiia bacterium]NNK92574.1 DUF2179 domain-containing protein [Acidimicrobiia bacterium]
MNVGTFLLVLLIFSMRVVDVSLGTLRIVMLMRGLRGVAGLLGFFESLTWVLAAALVLDNLDSPFKVVAFAAGFATGTVLGSTIERWLALGKRILRVVTSIDSPDVAPALRRLGHGVTVINGEGLQGDVRIAFSVIPRKAYPEVMERIRALNPDAFVTVEDIDTPRLERRRTLMRR